MNKSYRSIWNESLGAWVAASEITSARGKRSGSSVTAVAAAIGLVIASFGFAPQAGATVIGPTTGCTTGSGTGPDGTTSYGATANPIDGSGVWSNVAGCSANGGNFLGVTLFGSFTTAQGVGATAVGMGSVANKLATALGHQAQATGITSVAVGFNARGVGDNSVAMGNAASAQGVNGIAIGLNANAASVGSSNLAIGWGANASGTGAAESP